VTKAELVVRAREGDRDAFDLLMTAVIDHLYRIAASSSGTSTRPRTPFRRPSFGCRRHLPGLRDPVESVVESIQFGP
jgi:hypothetical protein